MRTTRAIAKTFCVELESELPSHTARNNPSSSAVRYINVGRMRTKRMVNNPWGNKGRKKCAACRTRKRNCVFDDENLSCEFCTAHGQGHRCGPKVFAEKARYFHSKAEGRADSVKDDPDALPSQFPPPTTVKLEQPTRYTSHAAINAPLHAPQYTSGRQPLSLSGFVVPPRNQMPTHTFNISTPASFSSVQSSDGYGFPLEFQPTSDPEPTYTATPFAFSLPPEQDLLPLYTDPCDDEIFEMSGLNNRFVTPPLTQYGHEQHPSFATYMCIRRFA